MKRNFVALLAASALASPGIAFAQDAAPAEEQGGLEEIIVTAQKRAEGLSDVPISISAISGKQVENYGQTNLEQISSSVPNLKITQTAIDNRIAIRGIAGDVTILAVTHRKSVIAPCDHVVRLAGGRIESET